MTDKPIVVIKNARFNLARIASSGQPTAEQFSLIQKTGYDCVINLAMPTSTDALADEQEIVTSLGMDYVHIPVEWRKPEVSQLAAFFNEIENRKEQLVWVHCALNYRVSTFLYLYRVIRLGDSQMDAWQDVLDVWQPDEVWCAFIRDSLTSFGLECEIDAVR